METKTKTFLNPENLLKSVPIEPGMIVADFGCGNGYYAVAAAVMTGNRGQVFALDILEDSLSQTASLSRLVGARNITTQICDLEKMGSCKLDVTSFDLVIVAGLLHQVSDQDNVVREAYRLLKTGGRILVVEWLPEAVLGPEKKMRVAKDTAAKLMEKYGFRPVAELPAGSFHYALLYRK